MSPEAILAYWEKREEAIKDEKSDPYRFGFELDTWKLADEQLKTHEEILVMGENRALNLFLQFCISIKSKYLNVTFQNLIKPN